MKNFRPALRTAVLAAAAALAATHPASHAALQARDLDGNAATAEAYYDTVLNISWLADANLPLSSGFDADGQMSFADANNWAAGLNFHGITGWRLPIVMPRNGTKYDISFASDGSTDQGYALQGVGWGQSSEFGHLYYVTLNNPRFTLANGGPFINLDAATDYWTDSAPRVISSDPPAWFFHIDGGLQALASRDRSYRAWAVHNGDVGITTAVPEPQTWALLAGGLAALAARRGRGRAHNAP